MAIAPSTRFHSLRGRSVYPVYLYLLCSRFKLCHTPWECLSTSCFSRLLGMIACVFLKATKTVISNVIRGKNISNFPALFSAPWSSFWYLLLDTPFYPHLPSFYGENFPQQYLNSEVQTDFYESFKMKLLLQNSSSLLRFSPSANVQAFIYRSRCFRVHLFCQAVHFHMSLLLYNWMEKLVRHCAWLPTCIWLWRSFLKVDDRAVIKYYLLPIENSLDAFSFCIHRLCWIYSDCYVIVG